MPVPRRIVGVRRARDSQRDSQAPIRKRVGAVSTKYESRCGNVDSIRIISKHFHDFEMFIVGFLLEP